MLPTRGDGMLNTPAAARLVGVKPATIRSWRKRGWLVAQGLDEHNRPLHTREAVRAAERRVRENGLRQSGIDPRQLRRRQSLPEAA
jgi:DNA-binding transcriptional MerR regulator